MSKVAEAEDTNEALDRLVGGSNGNGAVAIEPEPEEQDEQTESVERRTWSAESRESWQVSDDTPETLEFVDAVSTAPSLVAAFCGHVHFAHADAINTRAVQYVGAPGFEGGRRLVEFRPL